MLTVTKTGPNRVDLDLTGRLDATIMHKALDELIAASEGVTQGRMLYTIPQMIWPTVGAIGVELAHLPKLFGLLGKFDKCAVLTDEGWLKTAAEFEGALIPGLTIKAFGTDQRDQAEAWLAA